MTWLEKIQNASPRFDYENYKNLCNDNNMPVRRKAEWAQLMGIMSAAEYEFPSLDIETAYNNYIEIINTEPENIQYIKSSINGVPTMPPCGSCGGGRVL